MPQRSNSTFAVLLLAMLIVAGLFGYRLQIGPTGLVFEQAAATRNW